MGGLVAGTLKTEGRRRRGMLASEWTPRTRSASSAESRQLEVDCKVRKLKVDFESQLQKSTGVVFKGSFSRHSTGEGGLGTEALVRRNGLGTEAWYEEVVSVLRLGTKEPALRYQVHFCREIALGQVLRSPLAARTQP
eukprot:1340271-Rhodomonas_salina.2